MSDMKWVNVLIIRDHKRRKFYLTYSRSIHPLSLPPQKEELTKKSIFLFILQKIIQRHVTKKNHENTIFSNNSFNQLSGGAQDVCSEIMLKSRLTIS